MRPAKKQERVTHTPGKDSKHKPPQRDPHVDAGGQRLSVISMFEELPANGDSDSGMDMGIEKSEIGNVNSTVEKSNN